MPKLKSFFNDNVRVEQQYPRFGSKWRVYQKDADGRFQIVKEFAPEEEDQAVAHAQTLGD